MGIQGAVGILSMLLAIRQRFNFNAAPEEQDADVVWAWFRALEVESLRALRNYLAAEPELDAPLAMATRMVARAFAVDSAAQEILTGHPQLLAQLVGATRDNSDTARLAAHLIDIVLWMRGERVDLEPGEREQLARVGKNLHDAVCLYDIRSGVHEMVAVGIGDSPDVQLARVEEREPEYPGDLELQDADCPCSTCFLGVEGSCGGCGPDFEVGIIDMRAAVKAQVIDVIGELCGRHVNAPLILAANQYPAILREVCIGRAVEAQQRLERTGVLACIRMRRRDE